jgi:hypothetical protein
MRQVVSTSQCTNGLQRHCGVEQILLAQDLTQLQLQRKACAQTVPARHLQSLASALHHLAGVTALPPSP